MSCQVSICLKGHMRTLVMLRSNGVWRLRTLLGYFNRDNTIRQLLMFLVNRLSIEICIMDIGFRNIQKDRKLQFETVAFIQFEMRKKDIIKIFTQLGIE